MSKGAIRNICVKTEAGVIILRSKPQQAMIEVDFSDVEERWASVIEQRNQAQALNDRLRLEAQVHAGEARAHKSTVQECYQSVSGGTGEPATWNGAKPVERAIAAATDLADTVHAIIGTVLDRGEIKPDELDMLQDAVDTYRSVRRGAYYPVTDIERRAVSMSKAEPKAPVVIILHDGQQFTHFERDLVSEEERSKDGCIVIARFLGGTIVKE